MPDTIITARDCICTWFADTLPQDQDVSLLDAPDDVLAACRVIADAANSSDEAESKAAIRCIFTDLVEVWNDSFRVSGRNIYARLFSHIIWHSAQGDSALLKNLQSHGIHSEQELLDRHHQLRSGQVQAPDTAKSIVILSRVTIGADILLSTVLIQHLQEKYPHARITFIGDKKLAGLFGGFRNIRIQSIAYARRGTLQDRLRSWIDLDSMIQNLNADLIVAPDSRLDQLGIMPLPLSAPYLLWENTQANGNPKNTESREHIESLSLLLDRWSQKVFAHTFSAVPALHFDRNHQATADTLQKLSSRVKLAAIKLDFGGNADKCLPREEEIKILKAFRDNGWNILIDRGFGDEELKNSDQLMNSLGWTPFDICDKPSDKKTDRTFADLSAEDFSKHPIMRFYGSIAAWATCVSACHIALSYDSVGHHMAAALGIPVIIAFTGYQDDGFPIAWQPRGNSDIHLECFTIDEKESAAEKIIAHIPQA